MPDFTIKSFKDVDDSAADRPDLEARFARKHLDSQHLGVSYFRYGPDGEMVQDFWADEKTD